MHTQTLTNMKSVRERYIFHYNNRIGKNNHKYKLNNEKQIRIIENYQFQKFGTKFFTRIPVNNTVRSCSDN